MFSNELICKILEFIDENINKKITVDELAKRFYYNRYYIMKLFKKEIGLTIFDYINNLKIYNSILMINNSNKSLLTIAIENGFYSIEYFSEIFRKIIGVSPSVYKKTYYFKYNKFNDCSELCINNVIMLNTKINQINKYKQNLKPQKNLVRKISIFN